jgi:hypothetical protein
MVSTGRDDGRRVHQLFHLEALDVRDGEPILFGVEQCPVRPVQKL